MTRSSLYLVAALAFAIPSISAAADTVQAAEAARTNIKATLGVVPSFVGSVADAALPGLWQQVKAFGMAGDTALDPKTKALISLAVAAQIPCNYCIFSDTLDARRAGASDQEIAEAVAQAGLTRNVSTILQGMQIDLSTYKAEMGGN